MKEQLTLKDLIMNEAKQKEKEKMSREANYFARCLLMPKVLVEQEFDKVKQKSVDNNHLILKLSEIFNVEVEAMRFRLQELKLLDFGLSQY